MLINSREVAISMVDKMDAEFIELLKNNLLQERERNLEYVAILKDYIQHLKYEVIEKNKDIYYKNNLIIRQKPVHNHRLLV